jgi:hypothetical protein
VENRDGQRTPVRKVRWFGGDNGPIAYLLSVIFWLPGSVLAMILDAEGHGWLALLIALPLFCGAFFTLNDMWLDAVMAQRRSMFGPWALRASAWLMFGGAVPQAVSLMRRKTARAER